MMTEYKNSWLKDEERIDDLQRDGLMIIQHPGKFCFGIDAVLLSGFCRLHRSYKVVDFGTGTGILPILLFAKTGAEHFVGIEIQPAMADMASRSVKMNGLADRISIINGDLKEASAMLGKNCYEAVVCNPPYYKVGGGKRNPVRELEIARHEVMCTIEDVVRESRAILKENGHFFMIYTASRLAEVLCLLSKSSLQPKRIRLIYPYAGKDANLFMVEAVKGGREGMIVESPLIVYREPGIYTDEVKDIYSS